MNTELYNLKVERINGTEEKLAKYEGKVLLIVNVASKCGLTPQYEALEALYEKYKSQGLEVLGFPANEFLAQEPGSNAEIQEFCQMKFGIKFPMFGKIVVKGAGQHPLYKMLTNTIPTAIAPDNSNFVKMMTERGLINGEPNDISWNFEKFLIGRDGKILARFTPDTTPTDPKLTAALEQALK